MGFLSEAQEATFAGGRDDVFDAMMSALPSAGMKIKSSDRAAGYIEASTGMSLASWGEKIRIELDERGEGQTTASISSGNKAQLVSWGKNKRNVDKIVTATSEALAAR